MQLSDDALVFAMGYLSGPKNTLSFGGKDAKTQITDRGRAALTELLEAGACEATPPTDQWVGREYYRGILWIGPLAKEAGLNPFSDDFPTWTVFE